MSHIDVIPDADLAEHRCLRSVDKVARDPSTTAFKRRARLQQALWREARGFPIGSYPVYSKLDKHALGSRLECEFAFHSWANFLSAEVREAVESRLSNTQPHQMLDRYRLMCDLLSSMPMCFNLFGALAADLAAADSAVHQWWPDAPGIVSAVHFEWSPGRCLRGEYLENRSAFDVAFELTLEDGTSGIIGVETKYHEHCRKEQPPSNLRGRRYREVAAASGIFNSSTVDSIVGSDLQQVWLDHLLALSMLQHPSHRWTWSKFVLVHPAANSSYVRACERYKELLANQTTFETFTIESLLRGGVLPPQMTQPFVERYLW
jgi:hypothetical protein